MTMKDCANGERRNDACRRRNNSAADSKHEKEGADKFRKYFFILVLWIGKMRSAVSEKFLYRNGVGRGSYISDREYLAVIRHSAFVVPAAPQRSRLHFVPDGPEIVENRLEKRLFQKWHAGRSASAVFRADCSLNQFDVTIAPFL